MDSTADGIDHRALDLLAIKTKNRDIDAFLGGVYGLYQRIDARSGLYQKFHKDPRARRYPKKWHWPCSG
jgi:hypothetical protein